MLEAWKRGGASVDESATEAAAPMLLGDVQILEVDSRPPQHRAVGRIEQCEAGRLAVDDRNRGLCHRVRAEQCRGDILGLSSHRAREVLHLGKLDNETVENVDVALDRRPDKCLHCSWVFGPRHAATLEQSQSRLPECDVSPVLAAMPIATTHPTTGGSMPKGYWVSVYPTITDPDGLDVYNELAGRAVKAAGGRVLASIGSRVVAHEAGIAERVVLIEFDSFEQAVAAYESAAYKDALSELPDGFERDFRIIESLN